MIDMSKFTDAAKQFDVSKFDVTKIDLSTLQLPEMKLPEMKLPEFDLPKFDLPKFDLPKFDLPEVDVQAEYERVTDVVRDTIYAGIGMWVLAAEKVDAEVRKVVAKIS